jgi:hypothetical protein
MIFVLTKVEKVASTRGSKGCTNHSDKGARENETFYGVKKKAREQVLSTYTTPSPFPSIDR